MPGGNGRSFFDLYAHRMVRVAAAVPRLALADPAANAREIARLWREADGDGAALVVFPELALSGYSLDDLHQQEALLAGVLEGLGSLAEATREGPALLAVGAPLRFDQRLFNCAVVLAGGRILAIAPKSYLPNYREFYEKRQFSAARDALSDEVECLGQRVPFGNDILLRCEGEGDLALFVEVCEDLWVPLPPSTRGALGGATVLVNLSASNVTIGKPGYRHQLAAGQSAKCIAGLVYVGAGPGESTTDLAWDGHAMIYENGELLGETERFGETSEIVAGEIDLDRLVQDRMRMTSFVDCATDHAGSLGPLREVPFAFAPRPGPFELRRRIERFPYVPADPSRRDERCAEAYHIQVAGLVQRMRATGIEKLVIGVSGGLDSTQALLVSARATDRLGLPRESILAVTMPGYATSRTTLENAQRLMRSLGVQAQVIDIRPSCERMLADIGHPFARGEKVYDATFENVQAGERTSHLFRLANLHGGLVVGTGDLSELALGWCTYGVGDQMAHYSVNASIPKTLVRHLIEWVAESEEVGSEAADVLRDILATPVSPELVPGEDGEGPHQRTEELIGPFELHDFSLYHLSRRGYRPAKVAYLAARAWARDVPGGDEKAPYALDEVVHWLEVFLDRFFRTSQFKRSALPNGPKVGSGGSLSPRGDWRAPSDSSAAAWLADLEKARRWIERSR